MGFSAIARVQFARVQVGLYDGSLYIFSQETLC
ncbi:hypothetical protein HME9302_00413 [Alteripontixanthobacter maritimus]|uniref:Uncharacterized protein n=1 Tax=Alteripontixanthobacter maritimus TaxID=2161824 RepID=A0A369Q7G8_9SPHN|nr:hypothetical protein HME9302_00413 [Alteripontixanthobacter maritimus]